MIPSKQLIHCVRSKWKAIKIVLGFVHQNVTQKLEPPYC
jgi:hypothetical protein